jgi:hypothetical protein
MPEQYTSNEIGLLARMKEYFGYMPGKGAPEFLKETKALSYEDKTWFANEFNKMGLPTSQPLKTAAT